MQNLVGTPGMFADATLNNANGTCDGSPQFGAMGIPFVCVGEPVQYNPGVYDLDGNSLVFSLVTARFATPAPFPVTYQPGFSGAAPIPGITIDPTTGQLGFTPSVIGNYVVVVQVSSYDANGVLIGTVMADIMFVVQACNGAPPTTTGLTNNSAGQIVGPGSIEVCAGQDFCVDLIYTDNDPTSIITAIATTIGQLPGATFDLVGTNPVTVTLCWTADAALLPFNLQIQATDNDCPIDNVATNSVFILLAPPPIIPPDAGISGITSVCNGDGNVDLFLELGGSPDGGGLWSGPDGNDHSGVFVPGVDLGGTYTYTVVGGCLVASATVDVSAVAGTNAGTNGVLATCSNGMPVDLFILLGGGPDAGGTWTGPGGSAFSGIYDPLTDGPGDHVYTIPAVDPCPATSATVTVTEGPAPDAGTDGAITLCGSSAAVGLLTQLGGTPDPGGTWIGASPVSGGQYDPGTMDPGDYVYSVVGMAPCMDVTATVSVSEVVAPSAGSNGSVTYCSNGMAGDLFGELGGIPDPGGSWTGPSPSPGGAYDPNTMIPGDYIYTINGSAPCGNASATVVVMESAAPNAGSDASLTLCSNSGVTNLFNLLGGAAVTGGVWTGPSPIVAEQYDAATMDPGDYVYTVTGIAPCSNSMATVTVVEILAAEAGTVGAVTTCSSDPPFDLFLQLGGFPQVGGSWTGPSPSPLGMYAPATMAPGAYTYTVVGIAPCGNAMATVSVTENQATNAGLDGMLTLCSSSSSVSLFGALGGAPQLGGNWTGPSVVSSGQYDPVTMLPGNYIYTVTGAAPCASSITTVTVSEAAAPNAGGDGAMAACANGNAMDLFVHLGGAPQPGGSWNGPSPSPAGMYDPSAMLPGDYFYVVIGLPPCSNDTAIVVVTQNSGPNAGSDGDLSSCSSGGPLDLFLALGGSPQPGGTWSGPSLVVNNVFDPATMNEGDYTYTVMGVAPCFDGMATVTVQLVQDPGAVAGTDGSLDMCSNDPAQSLSTALGGAPQAGGTWSGPSVVVGGLYHPAMMEPGGYSYTVSVPTPCPDATAMVMVTESMAPNAGTDGSLVMCDNSGPTSLIAVLGANAEAGGTWNGPSPVVNGMFDPDAMIPGAYTYTVNAVPPCTAAFASVNVVVQAAPNAGMDADAVFCTSDGPVALLGLLGGDPQFGGSWTGPTGPVSGTLNPASGLSGDYIYTMNGVAPCLPDQATVTIALSTAADAGSNGSTVVCANAEGFNLFPLLGNDPDPGGTWTDDQGQVSSGSFVPGQNETGTYHYTLTPMAPCPAVSSYVVVDVLPVPQGYVFVESDFTCVPMEVTLSHDYTGPGTCVWSTGLGPLVEECGPISLVYDTPGSYLVSVTIDGGNGCAPVTLYANGTIDVFDKPVADFFMLPDVISTTSPIAYFNNTSMGATAYIWEIEGQFVSSDEDLRYVFPDVLGDEFEVCLYASASASCVDTMCVKVNVEDGLTVYVPNTFTPNDDGINDQFLPIMIGIDTDSYQLEIFDRWGLAVFNSKDPFAAWDGTLAGQELPVDVYVWKLSVHDRFSTQRLERIGHVTLLR